MMPDGIMPQSPPIGPGRMHLQQYERAYLEQIDNNTPVFNLFKRLCPYFHGKHHIEEIMWREKVSRKAFLVYWLIMAMF